MADAMPFHGPNQLGGRLGQSTNAELGVQRERRIPLPPGSQLGRQQSGGSQVHLSENENRWAWGPGHRDSSGRQGLQSRFRSGTLIAAQKRCATQNLLGELPSCARLDSRGRLSLHGLCRGRREGCGYISMVVEAYDQEW